MSEQSIRFSKALAYAAEKHADQVRKDGTPYIYHPVAVAGYLREQGFGMDYQMAGLFHDLLEDTDATEFELLALSTPEVVEAVKLVTKTEGYDEQKYIDGILQNPMAKAVKNADRIHNLHEARHADAAFVDKYIKETEEFFKGRFSEELDQGLEELRQFHFAFKNPLCNNGDVIVNLKFLN